MVTLMKLWASAVWAFILPMIRSFLTKEGAVLIVAAKDAVKSVSETMPGATGAEKRSAAMRIIVSALASQGVTIASSLIFAAIETAVQGNKDK